MAKLQGLRRKSVHALWESVFCTVFGAKSSRQLYLNNTKVGHLLRHYAMAAGFDRVRRLGGFAAPHRGRDKMRGSNNLRGKNRPPPRLAAAAAVALLVAAANSAHAASDTANPRLHRAH